jgi:hypothetical protein
MPLRTELTLGRSSFEKNWKRTVQDVRVGARQMKQETRGIGDGLGKGIKGAGREMMGLIGLGGGLVGVMQGVKSSLQWADDMADLTQKLNESAEVLQRVDYAAQQAASVGVEQVAKAMLKLEDNLGDITNTKVSEAFDNIGISAKDLIGLPLDQKLLALSSAFQEARATGVGLADAKELMGRQAEELIPLLNLSQEALEDMFAAAPALADEAIQKMAELNDKFDGYVLKSKGWIAKQIDEVIEWGKIINDVASTGSIDTALVNSYERGVAADQARMSREEARKANAEAIESSRAAAEQEREEAAAVRELTSAMEKLMGIKEAISDTEINLLPDDQKVGALQQKLNDFLEAKTERSIFKPSLEGLQSMADSREFALSQGGTDREGVIEAFSWLKEARDLQIEIDKLIAKQAEDELDKATEERDALIAAREKAAQGEFELMSPEEQFSAMRDRLSDSLGIDIKGAADLETGLTNLRDEVKKARESGDMAAEKAALNRLNEAQEQVGDFREMGERLDDAAQSNAPAGQVGEMGSLINQIFGRDPQQQQIERLGDIDRKLRDNNIALDQIIKRMDQPPERDHFDDT